MRNVDQSYIQCTFIQTNNGAMRNVDQSYIQCTFIQTDNGAMRNVDQSYIQYKCMIASTSDGAIFVYYWRKIPSMYKISIHILSPFCET
jgi:hypothetical protein